MDEQVLGRVANASFFSMKDNRDNTSFIESFRPNQIECKTWLVDEIANFNPIWKRVLVLGSWNGILLWELMREHCCVNWFDFVDIDPEVHNDRDIYFEVNGLAKNYSSVLMDATDFSDHSSYDLIINTSCEHMADIPAEYGPLYALQSNNYVDIEEHTNCVNSPKQLARQNNITRIMFHDSKDMGHYKRHMVIGYYS